MQSYRRGRRPRGYRSTKAYGIFLDGVLISSVAATSSQQAIRNYCLTTGTPVYSSYSAGACGEPINACGMGFYGVRACGRVAKCRPIFVAITPYGVLTADF